jgi:hypothetical protein
MTALQMIKQPGGMLRPANQVDADALQSVPNGRVLAVDFSQPRNPQFHRKFMALLNFGFEYWQPEELEYRGMKSVKSFDRFRKEVTVLAGYYTVTTTLKGDVRLEAKSISFGKMGEEEFHKLYRAVFSVLWKYVLSKVPNMTENAAEQAINELLSFD